MQIIRADLMMFPCPATIFIYCIREEARKNSVEIVLLLILYWSTIGRVNHKPNMCLIVMSHRVGRLPQASDLLSTSLVNANFTL